VTTLATGPQATGPQRRPSQPTLANWQEPPHNRWAFQHVRELVPTARIRRAPGPVRRLAYADQEMDPRIAFSYEKENLTLEQLLADSFTDGFIVLHRGRVVFERYFNGMAPDMPHLLMSVSKSVTAAVAGALAGRAALDVRARVEVVVPELAGTSFAGASVQDLLDMRAGTKFNEDYADLDADVRTYERVYLWRPPVAGEPPDPADATEYFGTLGNDGTHGGPFRYRSILTDVLAWVLERAAGQRLNELVERELWQPMGAEFDADVTVDGHGNPMADGGISATLRDIGRSCPPGGSTTPFAAPPTARPRSPAAAARLGTRPARTTGTAGGCATRRCPSSTRAASTGSTSSCTAPPSWSSPSCRPGPTHSARRWPARRSPPCTQLPRRSCLLYIREKNLRPLNVS
jgi:hypothetical protein